VCRCDEEKERTEFENDDRVRQLASQTYANVSKVRNLRSSPEPHHQKAPDPSSKCTTLDNLSAAERGATLAQSRVDTALNLSLVPLAHARDRKNIDLAAPEKNRYYSGYEPPTPKLRAVLALLLAP